MCRHRPYIPARRTPPPSHKSPRASRTTPPIHSSMALTTQQKNTVAQFVALTGAGDKIAQRVRRYSARRTPPTSFPVDCRSACRRMGAKEQGRRKGASGLLISRVLTRGVLPNTIVSQECKLQARGCCRSVSRPPFSFDPNETTPHPPRPSKASAFFIRYPLSLRPILSAGDTFGPLLASVTHQREGRSTIAGPR